MHRRFGYTDANFLQTPRTAASMRTGHVHRYAIETHSDCPPKCFLCYAWLGSCQLKITQSDNMNKNSTLDEIWSLASNIDTFFPQSPLKTRKRNRTIGRFESHWTDCRCFGPPPTSSSLLGPFYPPTPVSMDTQWRLLSGKHWLGNSW